MDTPRLRLYKISAEHLEGFHHIFSNREASLWSSRGICKTLEESERWMAGLLPDQNPDGENYAVFLRSETSSAQEDGPMIGVVGVYRPSPAAELGYTLHPSAWGHGYATEAVAEFVRRFWELRPMIERMTAKTDGENVASIKVLEKCGFREIERAREEVSLPLLGTGMREVVTFEIKAPSVS